MSLVTRKPVFGVCDQVMLSYRDQLETLNFGFSKNMYYTIWVANNKGADQTARMHRLISDLCCSHMAKTGFPMTWHKCDRSCCVYGQCSNACNSKARRKKERKHTITCWALYVIWWWLILMESFRNMSWMVFKLYNEQDLTKCHSQRWKGVTPKMHKEEMWVFRFACHLMMLCVCTACHNNAFKL